MAPSPFKPLADAVEGASFLDSPAKAVGKLARNTIPKGAVKDALAGTWLGHALHPLLTDVVIGSFLSTTLLDLVGGDDDGRAQERLIGIGIAAYGPTALAGLNDWADTEIVSDEIRRVGVTHALVNSTALTLYTASLVARRNGSTGRAKLLSLAGAAILGTGGFLGGHLTFTQGVGPNQTAFDEGPSDWSEAIAASELQDGEPRAVVVGETPVMLLRHGDGIHALHDRCSHRGCSLADGEIEGEDVVCACHGSRFALRDGSVVRGPATTAQPVYEVRESGGSIEVRLPE